MGNLRSLEASEPGPLWPGQGEGSSSSRVHDHDQGRRAGVGRLETNIGTRKKLRLIVNRYRWDEIGCP